MAGVTVFFNPISTFLQILNNTGVIAPGALITTYLGGTVATLQRTFSDSTGLVVNPNPLSVNAAGRIVSASGAPVSFWTEAGVSLKVLITDSAGNLLFGPIDNIPAVNDLTNSTNALANQLASASNSTANQSGAAAGADLVANAMKSYDVFASVRAANYPVMAVGQTLIISVEGAITIGDGGGGEFYWSNTSTAADDGRTVLKPNFTVAGFGRYLRLAGLNQVVSQAKSGDFAVVSSTALVNDPDLQIPLQAGCIYLCQARLALLSASGTGQGWKVQFNFTGSINGLAIGGGVQSTNGTPQPIDAAINGALTAAALSATSGDCVLCDIMIFTSTAGLYSVQLAQNSSSANATILKAGSALLVTRVK